MHNQKSLVQKLSEASQKINQASLRGSGNYVVADLQIFTAVYRMNKIKRIFNL